MSEDQLLSELSSAERAMVAVAVLLDGHDAVSFLGNDTVRGEALKKAAKSLVALAPDLRLPFVGTILRNASKDLG
ncbi:MAG: hypothetical protein PHC51_00695 [bacterium]|nr:hypothetical protein [bacterium]